MRRTSDVWWTVGVCIAALVLLVLPLGTANGQTAQPLVNGNPVHSIDLGQLQRLGLGDESDLNGRASTNCISSLCSECHWLDSYNPLDTWDGHPTPDGTEVVNMVATTSALASGGLYLITITGTNSFWYSNIWASPLGAWEPAPMYASPATVSGDVGADWEYLFGYPYTTPQNQHIFDNGPLVLVGTYQVSLDNGVTFQDLVPMYGQVYSPSHRYTYLVTGGGKKAQFRINDQGPHHDNYGRYRICIQLLNPCGS